MLKPCSQTYSLKHRTATNLLLYTALTLTLLAPVLPLRAQSAAAGPKTGKPIASVRFGTNGSDPEGTRGPNQRILEGKVQNPSGKPVQGAVVYLKDKHDASMKTVIAGDDGTYRFGQLSQNRDYEVWAELDKKKGILKQISSFNDKPDILMNLKIE